MPTTTVPSASVHLNGDRTTIVIDIPTDLWQEHDGIEHPNNHRRFAGTVVVNGVPMHLQAMQVEEVARLQTANAAEYQEDLNSLYQLTGAGKPLATSESIADGQEFVPYAVPYES